MTFRLYLLASTILATSSGQAQEINMPGRVSIFNSKYESGIIKYVKGADIYASFSKGGRSDDSGRFQLEFVGIPNGTAVRIQADKDSLSTVNDYELNQVILGRLLPVQVFLATRRKLASAQTELYEISIDSLNAKRDALLVRLRSGIRESQKAINELKANLGVEIKDRIQAEALLNARVDELKQRMPDIAQQLATRNLDFASKLYIKAYKEFQKGEIETVLLLLNKDSLDASYQKNAGSIKEGKKLEGIGKEMQEDGLLGVYQNIVSRDLKAISLLLTFKYEDAIVQYDRIINICKEQGFDELETATWESKKAWLFTSLEKYDTALKYQLEVLELTQKRMSADNPLLAYAYNNLGITYELLNNYTLARENEEKSLAILQKGPDTNTLITAQLFGNLGLVYQDLGDYQKAIYYQTKQIRAQKTILDSLSRDVGISYSNIGTTYQAADDYTEAAFYQQQAVDILKSKLKPGDPILASAFNNLGLTLTYLNRLTEAEFYIRNAIAIQLSTVGKKNPNVATFYSNLAIALGKGGDFIQAIAMERKSIEIRREILDPLNADLGVSFDVLAGIYEQRSSFDSANLYYLKSIAIREKVLDKLHPLLAKSYNNYGNFLYTNGIFDSSLVYTKKALSIRETILDPKSDLLAITYHNIASNYHSLDSFNLALMYFKKEIWILEKNSDPEQYKNLANTYGDMSRLYRQMKNPKKQKEFEKKQRDYEMKTGNINK